jgi:hypothetical protein
MIKGWTRLGLIFGVCVVAQTFSTLGAPSRNSDAYSFEAAIQRGIVDLSSDRWSGHDRAPLIAALTKIDPGLVNRFAFFYGGPSNGDLDATLATLEAVHRAVPRALLGATLPEVVFGTYSVTLACPAGHPETFSGQALGGTPMTKARHLSWVDLSRQAGFQYYDRLGKCFVDMGFEFLHFENAKGVQEHSSDPNAALANYQRLARSLRDYAAAEGRPLYLSGDYTIATALRLEAVYTPARFFHLIPEMRKYQNRIARPGYGMGYSFVLSPALIEAQKARLPMKTALLVYVDNWDSSQDDLRRMMELDAENRRYLIKQSVETARKHGAIFVPSLDHCVGCVPPNDIGDPCELLPDGRTQYDALACGDLLVIEAALSRRAR